MSNILNKSPAPHSIGNLENTLISVDITGTNVKQNSIRAYVDGEPVYDGVNFILPYTGIASAITPIADGYHMVIDSAENYKNFVFVNIEAEDDIEVTSNSWAFLIGETVNSVYFSDGDGLKKIHVQDFVGESQEIVKTILTETSIPPLPSNDIDSIFGSQIDNTFCLAMSYNGFGTIVSKDEFELYQYSSGDNFKGQITSRGQLYVINKDINSIEVYYGVHNRNGSRPPDFVYNSSSTPAILTGDILTLHVVNGVSTKYSGGTRLYVGTTTGVTRIETYDRESTDGYSAGYDSFGVAITYSISGGIGMHKSIGGTIPDVTSISSDDERGIFLVATQDGLGNGGLTQISLSTNKKKIYMTKESNDLPSNKIKDIWGKNGGKT